MSVNRSCRSTLAHECGHGLLHGVLFTELWRNYRRCQKRGAADVMAFEERMEDLRAGNEDKKWWEYQANRAMSALLVPRDLLLASLRNTTFAGTSPRYWTMAERALFRDHVCLRFDVSRSLAENRIEAVFPAEKPKRLPVKLITPLVSLRSLLPVPVLAGAGGCEKMRVR